MNNRLIGFEIEGAKNFIKLPIENVERVPEFIRKRMHEDYIWGIGKLGEELIFFINFEEVLKSAENPV